MTVHTPDDTISIRFEGPAWQPLFSNRKGDTLPRSYTIESTVFKSLNGNLLNGWIIKPLTGQPAATILHFHGNSGWLMSQYRAILPLVAQNFQVFIFDYSGFGFSEGKATRRNVLTDAISAMEYVSKRQDVAGTSLVLYGQSLGGHLAAVVAGRMERKINALVIEAAFSSHSDIAAYHTKRTIGIGFAGRLLVREMYNGKKYLKNYKGPVLVIHSREDNVIPFRMGETLYVNANAPKEFYPVDGCHICAPRYYAGDIASRINKMITRP